MDIKLKLKNISINEDGTADITIDTDDIKAVVSALAMEEYHRLMEKYQPKQEQTKP